MGNEHTIPLYNRASRTANEWKNWLWALIGVVIISSLGWTHHLGRSPSARHVVPINAQQIIRECLSLNTLPGPPPSFASRTESDRYEPGTRVTLIQNATLWTGGDDGREVIVGGEILIDKGIIKAVGEDISRLFDLRGNVFRINAELSWVTPGINDLHSHLGVDSVPELEGSSDTNSWQGITQPWLRSLDAIDTHDLAYKSSISGGITTSLVLPGSANAIGGQAFVIKLRDTSERSPLSKVLEPPYHLLNGTRVDPSVPPRWRHMKHAAGENPSRVYSGTRMDTIWKFRAAYNEARKIKLAQDEYCAKASAGQWSGLPPQIPQSLQWEALVDVLRGRVKVNIHIYETTDFTGIVGLSNEFKFPIAAFHHAHEAYLVPDVLKGTYGGTPGVAIFATNARYKKESYRGSEFAAKILTDNGIRVVVKSDHPVLNSRFLLYEAQQIHYYGVPENKALQAVTSTPAELMGFGYRIGYLRPGYDADIVIWDAHPLALGATPKQVFIDGIAQLDKPATLTKPEYLQHVPRTPNFTREAADAIEHDGLPPLRTGKKTDDIVTFINVKNLWTKSISGVIHSTLNTDSGPGGVVVLRRGEVICSGSVASCLGGCILPGLITYGSGLGLVEIPAESSTLDGVIFDPIRGEVPSFVQDTEIRAVDGLSFGGRNTLLAYRSGVTAAITPPSSRGFFGGLSTAFWTGGKHKLERHAVIQDVTALHVGIGHYGASVSTQIAALRKALKGDLTGDRAKWFKAASDGKIPLVVDVSKADHIATLLELKTEIDEFTGNKLRLVLAGAHEAHLLAKEISDASVSVILIPARQFPDTWDKLQSLPGPPLTPESSIGLLLRHGVTVGLGVVEEWEARNQRLDLGWAYFEANGTISKREAIALASSNLEKILGLERQGDLVAYEGGDFTEFSSKPIAIISPRREYVHLL
ncbi:composite domain of metallo-dependent hydrolase [Cantharellus anzutake]|uniref:composite domain of metallo-dependent hydrolase n=1 Tax=Cantharellus anzutake TaxID=1750568 RepID=UPI001908F4FC|nr:composite domain of metallo-dependent hydrolase [Cantharellus anzutake]KAF8332695.1 composite domain of metallo-dependent hydrolase [Cantharellus anzutake]